MSGRTPRSATTASSRRRDRALRGARTQPHHRRAPHPRFAARPRGRGRPHRRTPQGHTPHARRPLPSRPGVTHGDVSESDLITGVFHVVPDRARRRARDLRRDVPPRVDPERPRDDPGEPGRPPAPAHRRAALPPAPGRLLVRAVRPGARGAARPARRIADRRRDRSRSTSGTTPIGTHDHRGVFIPPGVAHGFASLTDMTITYLVDGYYNPADELGVAWDDPADRGRLGRRPTRSCPSATSEPASAAEIPERRPTGLADAEHEPSRHRRRRIHRIELRALLGRREHPGDRVVVLDLLTYAGNRASLDDVEHESPSSHGDIADLDARGAAAARPRDRRDRQLRRRVAQLPARCTIPGVFFRTNVVGTQTLLEAAAARRRESHRFHHISTCEVYGDLALDTDDAVHRVVAVPPAHAVQRVEGRRRPRRARLLRDLRAADHDHELRQQLRAVPVPGEGDPALRDQRARRPAAPDVRVDRRTGASGSTPSTTAARSTPCSTTAASARRTTSAPASRRASRRSPTPCLATLGKPASLKTIVPDRPGHDRRYVLDWSKIPRELGWEPQVDVRPGSRRRPSQWYAAEPRLVGAAPRARRRRRDVRLVEMTLTGAGPGHRRGRHGRARGRRDVRGRTTWSPPITPRSMSATATPSWPRSRRRHPTRSCTARR